MRIFRNKPSYFLLAIMLISTVSYGKKLSKEQKLFILLINEIASINDMSSSPSGIDSLNCMPDRNHKDYLFVRKDDTILDHMRNFSKTTEDRILYFREDEELFFCNITIFLRIDHFEYNSTQKRATISFSFLDLSQEEFEKRVRMKGNCEFKLVEGSWELVKKKVLE